MKKKGIIIGCFIAVLAIIICLVVFTNKSKKPKDEAKHIPKIIGNEKKIEKLFDKNIDFDHAYAFDNSELVGEIEDKKVLEEGLEKFVKEANKVDLQEYKDDEIDEYKRMFAPTDYKFSLKFKDFTDKKEYEVCPIIDYYTATYTYKEDGKNEETDIRFTFLCYKDKLIKVIPEESYTIDENFEDVPVEEDEDLSLGLSDEEIAEYNSKFIEYDEAILNKEELSSLLDLVISTNTSYAGDNKRFITVDDFYIEGFDNTGLFAACLEANPFNGGTNSKENVDKVSNEIRNLKAALVDGNTYKVTIDTGREIITKISIDDITND